MMFTIKMLGRFLRLFRRKEDGGPTVEFVLVFMPFMVLTFSSFELGLLMIRHVMLERGVSMAAETVALSTSEVNSDPSREITPDRLKSMVCNSAGILNNCTTQVRIEMRPVDLFTPGSVSASTVPREAPCLDLDNPFDVPDYTNGQPNELMIVRACGLFTPMLPEFGLGFFLSRMRDDGYYPLTATTAFVMEPI